MNIKLKKDSKSIFKVIIFGICMGSLCAVLDLFPYKNNIWTFSSFSGSLGFWAITGMIVLMQSYNRKLAGLNTFLYFSFMNASFFFVYLLLPIENPRITTLSQAITESLVWTIPSFVCGICAMIAYQAKKNDWIGSIALSLPIGLLLSEFIAVLLSVFINHKYLFQTVVDLTGIILLYTLYKDKKKQLFLNLIIVLIAIAILIFNYIINHNILYY